MPVCRTFRCSPDNERMELNGALSNPLESNEDPLERLRCVVRAILRRDGDRPEIAHNLSTEGHDLRGCAGRRRSSRRRHTHGRDSCRSRVPSRRTSQPQHREARPVRLAFRAVNTSGLPAASICRSGPTSTAYDDGVAEAAWISLAQWSETAPEVLLRECLERGWRGAAQIDRGETIETLGGACRRQRVLEDAFTSGLVRVTDSLVVGETSREAGG